MTRAQISAFCLLTLSLAASTPPCMAQTPAIAPGSQFTVPLTDGTKATAALLHTEGTTTYLVYVTPTGKLGSYLMTPTTTDPTPTPVDPTPTPTPTPPPAAPITQLITVADSTPADLSTSAAAALSAAGITYKRFAVADLAAGSATAEALKYIGLAAGKQRPYTFAITADGTIKAQQATPATETALLALAGVTLPATPAPLPCPASGCDCKQSQPADFLPRFRRTGR